MEFSKGDTSLRFSDNIIGKFISEEIPEIIYPMYVRNNNRIESMYNVFNCGYFRVSKLIQSSKNPITKLVEDYLIKHNIRYVRELPFIPTNLNHVIYFDFYLPDYSIDLELDDNWHNSNERLIYDDIRDQSTINQGLGVLRLRLSENNISDKLSVLSTLPINKTYIDFTGKDINDLCFDIFDNSVGKSFLLINRYFKGILLRNLLSNGEKLKISLDRVVLTDILGIERKGKHSFMKWNHIIKLISRDFNVDITIVNQTELDKLKCIENYLSKYHTISYLKLSELLHLNNKQSRSRNLNSMMTVANKFSSYKFILNDGSVDLDMIKLNNWFDNNIELSLVNNTYYDVACSKYDLEQILGRKLGNKALISLKNKCNKYNTRLWI